MPQAWMNRVTHRWWPAAPSREGMDCADAEDFWVTTVDWHPRPLAGIEWREAARPWVTQAKWPPARRLFSGIQ